MEYIVTIKETDDSVHVSVELPNHTEHKLYCYKNSPYLCAEVGGWLAGVLGVYAIEAREVLQND